MSLPILVALVALALLALAAIVLIVLAFANPEASRRRVLGLFRRPPRPARTPGQDHYYKTYWS